MRLQMFPVDCTLKKELPILVPKDSFDPFLSIHRLAVCKLRFLD